MLRIQIGSQGLAVPKVVTVATEVEVPPPPAAPQTDPPAATSPRPSRRSTRSRAGGAPEPTS